MINENTKKSVLFFFLHILDFLMFSDNLQLHILYSLQISLISTKIRKISETIPFI